MTAASLPAEDVQTYPRPAVAEPMAHRVEIFLGGKLIADTERAMRVLETHHAPTYYIPPDDVDADLSALPGQSFCEWKGMARYFDVAANGQTAARAAWTYVNPTAGFIGIAGYLAFYASKMELCRVGGVEVEPQPGDFYGGWITPNLTGIVKGGPGTEHW
ncbi:MAG: DUF427 domain-containing protein [Pseudomonadota bacterium]